MHAEQFLPDDTKVHTPIQAMIITYIQPTDEVLEPPIEKDQSDVSQKYVVYNNKLFQLVDNGPEGRSLYCSTSTAGRLRDGSSGQI